MESGEYTPAPQADTSDESVDVRMDIGSVDKVRLQRTMGLFSGIAVILGTIVGSGIFVSPTGVLMQAESVGLSLVIWVVCGFLCLLGAHCFAELGTCIKSSGGMYDYIRVAFNDLAAFLFLWSSMLIIFPAANAVIALTFAHYVLQPFFPTCHSPDAAVRIIAAMALALLTYVNCASVRWATRIQDVFTVVKCIALTVIIITGLVVLATGRTENFKKPFESSTSDPGAVALAFYSGLFSYSGWYTLNFLNEELKSPSRNLPRCIWISMPLITVIYTLCNVAYFAVLTPQEILESEAVAVTFAQKMYGVMSWIMPLFVAFSTFGSLNGCILSVGRLYFVGARQGHLPSSMALIQVNKYTPFPAILIQGATSIMMLVTSDIFLLINCVTFVEALSFLMCTVGLIKLRYTRPDLERPFKVRLIWPILFLVVCLFLLVIPLYFTPRQTVTGIVIFLSGIPVYVIFIMLKPRCLFEWSSKLAVVTQKVIMGVPQEGKAD